jgi:hypothetical protein
MKYSCILVFLSVLLSAQISFSQTFVVPKNIKLQNQKDYKRYEKDIINCATWLESTPVDKETEKRKDAGRFLMQWMMGATNVSVDLNLKVLPFAESSPDMLVYFMGGWTRYSLLNPGDTDKVHENLAGLKSVLNVYRANPTQTRDVSLDKLLSYNNGGDLEAWVKEQIK